MCERTVLVSGLPKDIEKNDLFIYFQSKKNSDGGDVDSIDYHSDSGTAEVTFQSGEVANRVANKKHSLEGHSLTVSKKDISNFFEQHSPIQVKHVQPNIEVLERSQSQSGNATTPHEPSESEEKVTAEEILSCGGMNRVCIAGSRAKEYKLLKGTTDPASKSIRIAGIKEEVNTAKQQVLMFSEENTIFIVPVEVDAVRTKYIHRFKQDEVTKIEDEFKQHSVYINQNSNGEGFTIHGTKEGTEKATKKVLQLVSQIKDKSIGIKKPGIKKLFSDSKGQKLLSIIENSHICIIERLSDENNMNTVGGNAAVAAASQTDQICSYVTPTGKKIIILKGDLTEFKVDVMVNVANRRLQHVGRLAKAFVVNGGKQIQDECDEFISRNNDLLDGEVFVSSPGKLPCHLIVHAVGPMCNNGSIQYEEKERLLAQAVFNALKKAEKFTSIAIPAFDGFPIDLCAKTMLESVLAYLELSTHVNLSEIYIIDMDDDINQAFYEEMKSRFAKEQSFTDSVTTADVGNISKRRQTRFANYCEGNKATTPDIKMSIIVGDLAEEKTHAIVNTVASDLDLSKNSCAKALSNAAGLQLQQECKGKGHLKPGDLLVTEGYKLGCKNVFHVVAEDWKTGKGEKVLRALIVSCLKEADKRGFSSIAYPAIGTGNLGFPSDVVAKVFFEEIRYFKNNHPKTSVLEVHFTLFYQDQSTIDAFQKEQKYWGKRARGNQQSQPLQDGKTIRGHDLKNALIGPVRIDLVPGDITKESTDAIITPSNQKLDVAGNGGVAAAIARAGGPSIQRECDMLGPQTSGSVVCTSAGTLPSRKLFHLIAVSFSPSDIADLVLKGLKMAESKEIGSIAIPAVGTGNAKISPKEAAKALLTAVEKFCKTKPKSLQHIRIVVFQEHMLEDFHRAIEELEKTKSSSRSSVKFFSWFKSVICRLGPTQFDVGDVDGMAFGKASYSLKVFASSELKLKEAHTAIKELIEEQTKRKVIDNSAIEGLSQTQEERILRLQEKYLTEIEIQNHVFKIIICGLSEDVTDTVAAVYEILNEKTEAEHERRYAELVSTTVQWYYEESCEREPYDDITNSKIEAAFKGKKDSVTITMVDETDKKVEYKIVFATMKESNLDTGNETDVHRKDLAKGIPLPLHWDAQPKDANGKENDFHLVKLDPAKNQQEYDGVLAAVIMSSAIKIVKIERVQNPELYRAYMVKKQKMDDKDGSNEKKLFHGTAVDTCKLINHKGFNRSYCGKNATTYGKGVYFARDASYSMKDTYSPPDPNGNRCIYLASVLVGQSTVGKRDMIAPPPKDPRNATITYDTTVNNANNPQVFVAYHDSQAYPEYLITFY